MSKNRRIPVDEAFAEWRKDPDYVAAYDALDEEFSMAARTHEPSISGPLPPNAGEGWGGGLARSAADKIRKVQLEPHRSTDRDERPRSKHAPGPSVTPTTLCSETPTPTLPRQGQGNRI